MNKVEFVFKGAIGAFDFGVQFWGAWRKHIESDSFQLAGDFEIALKLASAVDRKGADFKRRTLDKLVKIQTAAFGAGATVGLRNRVAGDAVAAREAIRTTA